jgi:hypothetical protein
MMDEFEHDHRVMIAIAIAAACWRADEPSHSWHVFEWVCWKLRFKYPLVMLSGAVINSSGAVT